MAASLAEEVKRRKVAEALLNGDQNDDDSDLDVVEEPSSEKDTEAPAEEEPTTEEPSSDEEPFVPAAEEKATPRLGYRFVPVSPPAATQAVRPPVSTPSPSFMGEQGVAVGPEMPKIYEGPEEEGGQRYVIDEQTGQKVPYAELATEADKAAQPPGGVELPKVTVTVQPEVRRAELVDPDPDRAYLQGVEDTAGPEVRRAYQSGVVPKAQLVDPDPDQAYLQGAQEAAAAAAPPKAQPALGYKFVPVAAQPEVRRAAQPGEALRAQPPGQVVTPAPAGTPETRAAFPPGAAPPAEPEITNQAQPGSYRPYQGEGPREVKNIIIHSSDGHEKGDIATLTSAVYR